MSAYDADAHHKGDILMVRMDGVQNAVHSPDQDGAHAFWSDGTTSYILHTRSGHVHGWTLADEADTVIRLVDAALADEEIGNERMQNALRDIRRLRMRLAAIENEAILYAQEEGHATLSTRQIAAELGLDHSTVVGRTQAMRAGRHAEWRDWLVQGSYREAMYATADENAEAGV